MSNVETLIPFHTRIRDSLPGILDLFLIAARGSGGATATKSGPESRSADLRPSVAIRRPGRGLTAFLNSATGMLSGRVSALSRRLLQQKEAQIR